MKRSDPLLDVAEAAEYLNVTERFVRRLVEEKRVTYVKLGMFVRFRPSDLDAFVEAGVQQGSEWRNGAVPPVRLHPRRRRSVAS